MSSSPPQTALDIVAAYFRNDIQALSLTPPTLSEFSKNNFYIPETKDTLTLSPHQISILDYAFLHPEYTTVIYSTIKKSGKTTIGSLVARWVAETWGFRNEVYCIANDYEQARGRTYQKVIDSIELNPKYNVVRRTLPGRWKIIERQAVHIPSGSLVRALSGDYKGEAGSNPTLTVWSELWGYTSENSRRLWEELTPVPTRARSLRFIETYAGYTRESDILLDLYNYGLAGKQLTHDDINWPFPDRPPIWVNPPIFMYWDAGVNARRMPWQTPEYYQDQARTLRPAAFDRLHLNLWTSSTEAFLPIEWWNACNNNTLESITPHTPIVLGVDAAVTSDSMAIVGVSRHPKGVQLLFHYVWYPPPGGKLDYTHLDSTIRALCKQYNVVQVAYDEYQLHYLMSQLRAEGIVWCRPFSQSARREEADKQLYDLIRDRKIVHNLPPSSDVHTHIKNASAKLSKDEDSRLRIVKSTQAAKVDLVVALSMAAYECLRLNL